MYSFTEPREAVLEFRRWWLERDGQTEAVDVDDGRRHGKTVIAHLAGVDDRDRALDLVGCEIRVPRECLPEPAPGRYYFSDLVGLRVVHRDGRELGTVAYVMQTGANDVLVTAGDKERLIPFVAEKVILDVDLAAGVIRVDWEWD